MKIIQDESAMLEEYKVMKENLFKDIIDFKEFQKIEDEYRNKKAILPSVQEKLINGS